MLGLAIIAFSFAVSFLSANQDALTKGVVEFSCVSWRAINTGAFYRNEQGEFIALDARKGRRTGTFSFNHNGKLSLYTRGAAQGEYTKLATCPLPDASGPLLVLLYPAQNSFGTTRLHAVSDPMEIYPNGGMVFVNLSDQPLSVDVAGETAKLSPSGLAELSASIPESGGFVAFRLKDSKDKPLIETRLFGQPGRCKMVFIYPPESEGVEYKVKFLTEAHAI